MFLGGVLKFTANILRGRAFKIFKPAGTKLIYIFPLKPQLAKPAVLTLISEYNPSPSLTFLLIPSFLLMENHNQKSGSCKRKRDEGAGTIDADLRQNIECEIRTQISILDSTFSSSDKDRESAKRAIGVLSELAKDGTEKLIKNRNEKLVFFFPDRFVNL